MQNDVSTAEAFRSSDAVAHSWWSSGTTAVYSGSHSTLCLDQCTPGHDEDTSRSQAGTNRAAEAAAGTHKTRRGCDALRKVGGKKWQNGQCHGLTWGTKAVT